LFDPFGLTPKFPFHFGPPISRDVRRQVKVIFNRQAPLCSDAGESSYHLLWSRVGTCLLLEEKSLLRLLHLCEASTYYAE
jgi:hypothetical protein